MSVQEAKRYLGIAEHDYRVLCLLVEASNGSSSGASPSEDTTDWQVALLYYILCIEVKALASCRGGELQDHYTIKQWLNTETDVLSIAKYYRMAEEWSRDARYEGRCFTKEEMRRYLEWFHKIHDHLGTLFTSEGLTVPSSIDTSVLL